jgi:hypothetical protein
MILMVVFAIGDFFAILLSCIFGKAMEFWKGGDTYQILRLTLTRKGGMELFQRGMRDMCKYGSFCHVSNIENIITLLLI